MRNRKVLCSLLAAGLQPVDLRAKLLEDGSRVVPLALEYADLQKASKFSHRVVPRNGVDVLEHGRNQPLPGGCPFAVPVDSLEVRDFGVREAGPDVERVRGIEGDDPGHPRAVGRSVDLRPVSAREPLPAVRFEPRAHAAMIVFGGEAREHGLQC